MPTTKKPMTRSTTVAATAETVTTDTSDLTIQYTNEEISSAETLVSIMNSADGGDLISNVMTNDKSIFDEVVVAGRDNMLDSCDIAATETIGTDNKSLNDQKKDNSLSNETPDPRVLHIESPPKYVNIQAISSISATQQPPPSTRLPMMTSQSYGGYGYYPMDPYSYLPYYSMYSMSAPPPMHTMGAPVQTVHPNYGPMPPIQANTAPNANSRQCPYCLATNSANIHKI